MMNRMFDFSLCVISSQKSSWTMLSKYTLAYIPGGPQTTEQSIQSIFQVFALINSYLFSPCWIEHLFLIIITPRSSNLDENWKILENFCIHAYILRQKFSKTTPCKPMIRDFLVCVIRNLQWKVNCTELLHRNGRPIRERNSKLILLIAL